MFRSTATINKRMVERIDEIYTRAELTLLEKVKARIAKGINEEGYYENKLKDIQEARVEIQKLLHDSHALAKAEVNPSLINTYTAGKDDVKLSARPGMPTPVMKNIVPYSMQRLVLETDRLIDGTSFQILRNVDDVFRDVTASAASNLMTGAQTTRQAIQGALNNYADRGVTGFVDKIGRKWDLQSYTTMAVRTTAQRAAIQGQTDRMQELGRDLVMVSTKGATCPLCEPWGGRILSLSGTSDKYPSLDTAKAEGLFHPNCQHTLLDYDEFDTELDKMLGVDNNPDFDNTLPEDNKQLYEATQRQRLNERSIRFWKKREAVALDPNTAKKAKEKIRHYQALNRQVTEKFGLPREYGSESVMKGSAAKAIKYKSYEPFAGKIVKQKEIIIEKPISNAALTADEMKWLKIYREGTGPVNKELRRGNTEFHPNLVNNITSAIDKFSLQSDMTLYRGASLSDFNISRLKPGTTILKTPEQIINEFEELNNNGYIDKGFLSTTKDKEKIKQFLADVEIKLKAPKGTKVIDMKQIFPGSNESEVLLQRNINYNITSISYNKQTGIYTVEMEVAGKNTNKAIKIIESETRLEDIKTLENFRKRESDFYNNPNIRKRIDSDRARKGSEELGKYAKRASIRTRVPNNNNDEVLAKIIEEDEFKNQFQIGSSSGTYDPMFRKKASNKMFGSDVDNMLDSEFEKYGYIDADPFELDIKESRAAQYGDTIIEFKDSIRSRTTFTVNDSLEPAVQDIMVPSLIDDVKYPWEWQAGDNLADIAGDSITTRELLDKTRGDYIEAQLHGRITAKDIKSVVMEFTGEPEQNILIAKLKAKGIKVGVHDHWDIWDRDLRKSGKLPIITWLN